MFCLAGQILPCKNIGSLKKPWADAFVLTEKAPSGDILAKIKASAIPSTTPTIHAKTSMKKF